MKKPVYDKYEVAIFQNRGPNNVAINVNKYIAKYDFDIARKVKPSLEELEEGEERAPEEPESVTRRRFATNAILEILQICSNELSHDDRCFESLWTLDG